MFDSPWGRSGVIAYGFIRGLRAMVFSASAILLPFRGSGYEDFFVSFLVVLELLVVGLGVGLRSRLGV